MSISKKRFSRGIILRADDVAADGIEGELKVGATSKKLHAYLDGALRNVVTESQVQTLTNKSIDNNNNAITNLDVFTLAPGVLNTDTALTGATDEQIPSALAVKTYVDDASDAVEAELTTHINNPTDAHDASAISNVPAGTISSTDVQAAINELDTDIQAHINDTVDAHDASAISFAPVGDLSATDVQSAIVELGTDLTVEIEQVASDLADHIADATDAHDGTAISIVPSGNLAATNTQTALYELQGDIDTINADIADDVEGPASSTDNAVARFDGTTGKLIQNSGVTISDTGDTTVTGEVIVDVISPRTSSAVGITSINNLGTENANPVESAITGTNALLPTTNSKNILLVDPALISLSHINAEHEGQEITIVNKTGNAITIVNDATPGVGEPILTGTGSDLTLQPDQAISLVYSQTYVTWNIIGGTGSGGGQSLDTFVQLTAEEQLTDWSTGDNATFLGGGTLSGTFTKETSSPLNGEASYKYTQAAGSQNDYLASPVQDVPIRFRGNQNTIFFPYLYNGNNDDITLVVYDVTNATVLTNSAFNSLDATGNNASIAKATVFIPLTCTQIRVGFQTLVANSGKILQFDDIQISADATLYADLIDTQEAYLSSASNIGGGGVAGGPLTSSSGSGLFSYNSGTGLYTVTRQCNVVLAFSLASGSTTAIIAEIQVDGASVALDSRTGTTGVWASSAFTGILEAGQTFRFVNGGAGTTAGTRTSVLATATSTNIVAAPETFSTDTAALTYAGSSTYTLSTLANAPVGTFITFTTAINTVSTKTQTNAAAPTQTTSDMNTNGIQIFTRPYNAASTSGSPATIAIQIGKGMKGVTLNLYKSTGKTTAGNLDLTIPTTTDIYGSLTKDYNESTGILIVDAAWVHTNTVTSHVFLFSDSTVQTNGYLTISASRNPALTGISSGMVAARGVNTAGTSIANATPTTITYDSAKTFDTHGALNTSTGTFTVPVAGYYQVSTMISTSNVAWTVGQSMGTSIQKNGVTITDYYIEVDASNTTFVYTPLTDVVFCNVGDTLRVQTTITRGASTTLQLTGAANYFSIAKLNVG